MDKVSGLKKCLLGQKDGVRFRFFRRVLPLLLLAAIAYHFSRYAPRESSLVWELGAEREGLLALEIEIMHMPEKTLYRRVEFRYSQNSSAPIEQSQRVSLTHGDYRADAVLHYSGSRNVEVTRTFTFLGQNEILVRL